MVSVQAYTKKRTLHHLRAAFEGSPWLRRVALRFTVQKIKEENFLKEVDDRIGKKLSLEDICPPGDRNRERFLFNIRKLVDEAPGEQGEALKCLMRKAGVDVLPKLESIIGTLKKNPEKFIV